MPQTPDIRAIYNLIQREFDALDQRVGPPGNRRLAITELPQLERDLYLVHDVVAITSISGTRAWIGYHHDEPGWVAAAADAFTRIGYPHVADGLCACVPLFRTKGAAMTDDDDKIPAHFIMDHEEQILRSLHDYLLAHHYPFQPHAKD